MPKKTRKPTRKRAAKPPSATRQRLSPAVRKAQIVDAAARLIVAQGFLPLPIEKLANAAGSSKALIYTYFPDQDLLFNTLLERELTGLLAAGLDTASKVKDLEQAAVLCSQLYFEHVARYGPLLNVLLSDRYMVGRIDRNVLRARNEVLQRLAQLAQASLPLDKREALAALEMITAIPEEAGRLAFHNEIDVKVARQICRSLIPSALKALQDPDKVLASVRSAIPPIVAV
ncbi:MAG TPA: TetR/AcrR family transcriptional regulator [Steroidobacteraceae bacterium]|nr:TetR/AcrR family transcriptional regulator [Steroidobacteraceae bacterium]